MSRPVAGSVWSIGRHLDNPGPEDGRRIALDVAGRSSSWIMLDRSSAFAATALE
jgi:hypothetical protein